MARPGRVTYMESLAEIQWRMEGGGPKPRPTIYKDIPFRSRLEVRFAWYLDGIGAKWTYEPRVYGRKGRGYLPDFEILDADPTVFIEVKPTVEEVDGAQRKMSVIWLERPEAVLVVACSEGFLFTAARKGGPWEEWRERWIV